MPVNSGDAMPVNMASRPRARVQGIYLIPVGRVKLGLRTFGLDALALMVVLLGPLGLARLLFV